MWWRAFKYIFAGALFFVVGWFFAASSVEFSKRSDPAQLNVIRLDARVDSDGQKQYRPVFSLVTEQRPQPEYEGNHWTRPAPHQTGDVVSGRYDANKGEMRSDFMMQRSLWIGRAGQLIGIVVALQGFLLFLGIPDALPSDGRQPA